MCALAVGYPHLKPGGVNLTKNFISLLQMSDVDVGIYSYCKWSGIKDGSFL
jgi:hypothetical protein